MPIKPPTAEGFELITPPFTMTGYCYKGYSAICRIPDTDLEVVLTAKSMKELSDIWSKLFPNIKPLVEKWVKVTVGQESHIEKDELLSAFEVPATPVVPTRRRQPPVNDCPFDADPPPWEEGMSSIYSVGDTNYRWHNARKVWIKL